MYKARKSPFISHCGIDVVSLSEGCAELDLEVSQQLLNSGAITHGGVLATLADSAAGAASWTVLADDEMAVTTDFNITCLRPTVVGDRLRAKAVFIHRGRRLMRAEVEVTAKGKMVAKAGVSFMVVARDNG